MYIKNQFKTKITLHISPKKDYPIKYNKERNIEFVRKHFFFQVVENRDDKLF